MFNDLFLVPDADNTAWETPSDLASERGRFQLTVTFDIAEVLTSDELFYAELASSLAVTLLRKQVRVVSVGLDDAQCEVHGG